MVNALSSANVVDAAKEVLISPSLACEWSGCNAQLNCWKALQEHMHGHTLDLEQDTQVEYDCALPHCASQPQATLYDLQKHIKLNHLAKVPIPCPIEGCSEVFGRPHQQLLVHVHDSHAELLNEELSCSAGRFKPTRHPFRAKAEAPKRDLPRHIIPTPKLVSESYPLCYKRPRVEPDVSLFLAPKLVVGVGLDRTNGTDDTESSQAFGDIPELACISSDNLHRKWSPQLARPAPPVYPSAPENIPPRSSGYPAFAIKFAALEEAGLVNGSGEWPEDSADSDA